MAIKNQKVLGGGVFALLFGYAGFESGIFVGVFGMGRNMLEAVSDAQTVANFGNNALSIIAMLGGVGALVWGFGGFDYVRDRITWKPNKISVLELANLSEKYGWQMAEMSVDYYGFGHALRQAGADGSVEISGRYLKNRQWMDQSATRIHPLIPIAATYFYEHWVDVGQALKNQNSMYASTSRPANNETETYCDLHVIRKQGLKWLRTEATLYRDMYREHTEAQIAKSK